MKKDTRGYRENVRVIVEKNGLILLGHRNRDDARLDYYLFPGGGVDEGETLEQATIKEVLEEVGVVVKNPIRLGLSQKYERVHPQPERAKLYRGGIDIWMKATYVKKDDSLFNSQGDSFKSEWVTPAQARRLINSSPDNAWNAYRLEGLDTYLSSTAKIAKESLQRGADNPKLLPDW